MHWLHQIVGILLIWLCYTRKAPNNIIILFDSLNGIEFTITVWSWNISLIVVERHTVLRTIVLFIFKTIWDIINQLCPFLISTISVLFYFVEPTNLHVRARITKTLAINQTWSTKVSISQSLIRFCILLRSLHILLQIGFPPGYSRWKLASTVWITTKTPIIIVNCSIWRTSNLWKSFL